MSFFVIECSCGSDIAVRKLELQHAMDSTVIVCKAIAKDGNPCGRNYPAAEMKKVMLRGQDVYHATETEQLSL